MGLMKIVVFFFTNYSWGCLFLDDGFYYNDFFVIIQSTLFYKKIKPQKFKRIIKKKIFLNELKYL